MLAQWIGALVGQMHNNKISKTELADHMGVSREYVSMVLNGHRSPVGAKDRFTAALNELIAAKDNFVSIKSKREVQSETPTE